MAANDELFDISVRHQVFLERLKTGESNDILTLFNLGVAKEIGNTVLKFEPTLRANKRFKTMQQSYEASIAAAFLEITGRHAASSSEIALMEAAFQIKSLNEVGRPIGLEFALPSRTQLKAIANQELVRGKLVKQWFSEIGEDLASRVTAEIQIGLVEGESIPQIVRRIRGTRAAGFSDGIINKTRNELDAIVRTSVNNVTTQAKELTYAANSDAIEAVLYIATLDSGTTVICGNLDGQTFPIGEGPRPPQHFRCRSTTSAIIKPLNEIPGLENIGDLPPSVRASFNGQVPATTTYPTFLNRQTNAFQNEALGRGKADIFRDAVKAGSTPEQALRKFTSARNRPLSLEAVIKKEGL